MKNSTNAFTFEINPQSEQSIDIHTVKEEVQRRQGSLHEQTHMKFLEDEEAIDDGRVKVDKHTLSPSHVFGDFDKKNHYNRNENGEISGL